MVSNLVITPFTQFYRSVLKVKRNKMEARLSIQLNKNELYLNFHLLGNFICNNMPELRNINNQYED